MGRPCGPSRSRPTGSHLHVVVVGFSLSLVPAPPPATGAPSVQGAFIEHLLGIEAGVRPRGKLTSL